MEIDQTLSKIFSKKNRDSASLNKKLATSCQQFFTKSIEFRLSSGPDSHLENLKAKYKPLNKVRVAMETGTGSPTKSDPKPLDFVPNPRHILHNGETLDMKWKRARSIGAGLSNMGNTCFLNSVLQCLSYTPPLVNYILSGEHKQKCGVSGFCVMCEFHKHCSNVIMATQNCVKPMTIVHNLRAIAKQFRLGRQEDAHEFLRYFIDGLQKSALHGYAKLDPHSKATTVIHQIFGGYHRSQVKCLQCSKMSNTYDPLLDVSLDIKNCNTLIKALQKSIKPDLLEGDNSYACPFCKKMTRAQKRFTVQKLPRVLTLQLKRFDFNSMFGGKVNKTVEYPERVNMRPYMSNTQGPVEWYKLYAVLVHFGYSSHSGHYYCYVRNSNNSWYCMNDSQVSQVSISTVLNQEAYLLFYIQDDTPTSSGTTPKQQGIVRSDPNFLSKKQNIGLNKSPVAQRKPTGVVQPSPKIHSPKDTPTTSGVTPSPPMSSVSCDQASSEPKKHVFVPRQIKIHGIMKKHPRDKNKEKLIVAPTLSPLAEENEDSPDPVIPLADAIQMVTMDTNINVEKSILDYCKTPPKFPIDQPGRFIGPLFPSPQRKSDEELTTSPRVALVSPQPQSGAIKGSGKPVARIRPTLHFVATTNENKPEGTCPEVATGPVGNKPTSPSLVGSTTSCDSHVQYGPVLSADDVTSSHEQILPEAKIEFNSPKVLKKHLKKHYRTKLHSDDDFSSDKHLSDSDKMSSPNNSESESGGRKHKHNKSKDHRKQSVSPPERKERSHDSKRKKYRSRSKSPGSKVRRSRSPHRHTHHHKRHSLHSRSPERVKYRSRSRSTERVKHKTNHLGESGGERVKDEEYRMKNKRKSHHGDGSPDGKRHKSDCSEEPNKQNKNVPEVVWDAGLKGQQSSGLVKWDGARQSDVLEQLTSKDRLGVKSWDGGGSNVVSGSARAEKRGGDSWDEELDRGKTKKVRRKSKEEFGSSNKFQQFHDRRSSTGSHHKPHKRHSHH